MVEIVSHVLGYVIAFLTWALGILALLHETCNSADEAAAEAATEAADEAGCNAANSADKACK